ncbi:MAG: glycosyltransferase, partial [Candidatus Acidiferrales bacterium]
FTMRRTYGWHALKVAWELSSLIRRENVSIVHSFFETSDLWGGAVAKLSGVPILVSSRRDMGIQREKKHDTAYRYMRRFTDLVLPVSNQVRDFCIERDGLDPKKVVTLHNGVEIERFANTGSGEAIRYAFGLENASHIVSAIANIRPVKGLDVMIRAAAIVCRKFPRACFVIVGTPHRSVFLRELKALAQELGIAGNVRFLGGHDEIERFLKISDAFCLPSRSEGFSNSLIEAMGCGLPCVATDVGGNREALQEGVSGYLVANEDSQAMGERILNLLENPELARRMGAAGRRKVEQMFTAEAMMSTLTSHYQTLLKQKRNGRQS